jgi:VWFA-related protein
MAQSTRSYWLLSLLLTALLALPAARFAQQTTTTKQPEQTKPTPAQAPTQTEQDAVVRISTQLVQIDAVVTDRKGEHVDDLKEDEVELLVDGKKQSLSFFRLVKTKREPGGDTTPREANTPKPGAPSTMPTRAIAPEKVARTIAFVVDDLGLSFESTAYTRDALKKFVDRQMQEGDLVGIIRTGRGLGALQQFTSDKHILYAAIDKLTWNPLGRDMIPRFGVQDAGSTTGEDAETRQARQEAQQRADDFRETVFSVGTLGAINFVVRGLRELPGRKMVVLISDGFRLFGRDRDNAQVLDNVRRLVDLANRSSVVIYSLDAKGLLPLQPTAADDLSQMTQQQVAERYSQVAQDNFDSQEGLTFVARETGGFAVLNNNDLNLGINRVLRDNESYYLLGFDPEDASFDRRFHNLKVRVKRAGLQVRTRAGFMGVADTAPRPKPRTRDEQILATLYSPFGARDLSLQMTSFFYNVTQPPAANPPAAQPKPKKDKENQIPAGTTSFVRSVFHIDANKLNFTEGADGKKQLKLELITFAFNEQGVITDQHGRSFTLNFDEPQHQSLLKYGILYRADIPIKKPGAYQFRAVLRDPASGKLGSSSQFIQVPDLNKPRLAISGLALAGEPSKTEANASQFNQAEWDSSLALRRFPRDASLIYAFVIYNAALSSATKRPELTMQTEIYREGKRIFQGQPRLLEVTEKSDLKHLAFAGQLTLKSFVPGDYMLRVVVNDKMAKEKFAQVDQWIDFSVR